MKVRTANCPACAGPVQFRASSSFVTICEFCHSVVARGDKQPEDHGKVADLAETKSPLMLGMSGRFRDRRFEVVGRVQYQHPSGATWNEWYLLFGGETWGWLAEAQSRLFLMFEKRLKDSASLPTFDALQLGQSFDLMKGRFTVSEKGIAQVRSAEGEIPWPVRPGLEHRYADLRGAEKGFATLEYAAQAVNVFVGVGVTADELQLTGKDGLVSSDSIPVGALQINCPKCAGALTLHVPDETLRVACPNCNSLLDADHGKLKFLQTLAHKQTKPAIPLGAQGTLKGERYTAIGYMERYVLYQGKAYPWTEYLLHNPSKGFRWLVNNSGHWSFVEPLDFPTTSASKDKVNYEGRTFRKYDEGTAHVRYVVGEFPWQVTVGETVQTQDFIAPPQMISIEHSFQVKSPNKPSEGKRDSRNSLVAEEINVSLGTYLPIEELEQAFGLKSLKRPWGVGTIQPAPSPGLGLYLSYMVFLGLIAGTYVSMFAAHPSKPPDILLMFVALGLVSVIPIGIQIYRYSFEVKRWENSDFSPYAQES